MHFSVVRVSQLVFVCSIYHCQAACHSHRVHQEVEEEEEEDGEGGVVEGEVVETEGLDSLPTVKLLPPLRRLRQQQQES